MQYFLGAYAASPNISGWDPDLEAAYYRSLATLASVKGLEHPFLGQLHQYDDNWFLQQLAPHWDYVFTTIPGVMNALAQQPGFGLASTDELDVLVRLIDARGRPGGPLESATGQGRLSADVEGTIVGASRLRGMDSAGVFAAWTEAGGRFTAIRGRLKAGDSTALISSGVTFVGRLGTYSYLDMDVAIRRALDTATALTDAWASGEPAPVFVHDPIGSGGKA